MSFARPLSNRICTRQTRRVCRYPRGISAKQAARLGSHDELLQSGESSPGKEPFHCPLAISNSGAVRTEGGRNPPDRQRAKPHRLTIGRSARCMSTRPDRTLGGDAGFSRGARLASGNDPPVRDEINSFIGRVRLNGWRNRRARCRQAGSIDCCPPLVE
jgi:hypothetical protein